MTGLFRDYSRIGKLLVNMRFLLQNCNGIKLRCFALRFIHSHSDATGVFKIRNELIFLLIRSPLLACKRRSCYSRLSSWLQTGSMQRDILARKRQWHCYANESTIEQNSSIAMHFKPKTCIYDRTTQTNMI